MRGVLVDEIEASTGVKTNAAHKTANTITAVNRAKRDRDADPGLDLDIKLSFCCVNYGVMLWLSNSAGTGSSEIALKQAGHTSWKRPILQPRLL